MPYHGFLGRSAHELEAIDPRLLALLADDMSKQRPLELHSVADLVCMHLQMKLMVALVEVARQGADVMFGLFEDIRQLLFVDVLQPQNAVFLGDAAFVHLCKCFFFFQLRKKTVGNFKKRLGGQFLHFHRSLAHGIYSFVGAVLREGHYFISRMVF